MKICHLPVAVAILASQVGHVCAEDVYYVKRLGQLALDGGELPVVGASRMLPAIGLGRAVGPVRVEEV